MIRRNEKRLFRDNIQFDPNRSPRRKQRRVPTDSKVHTADRIGMGRQTIRTCGQQPKTINAT